MRVLIFEDEALTAERLLRLLAEYNSDIEVIDILESVEHGVKWFRANTMPDLIFMDIQLNDGSCFELFEQVKIEVPVIFTTAYDQYALQAFKVNSIDYLLKPIEYKDLEAAIQKYKKVTSKPAADYAMYMGLLQQINKSYKQRFLVKIGDQLKYVSTNEVAYFVHSEGLVFAYTDSSKRHILDQSIEQIEQLVDPEEFFRINRKIIVKLPAIKQMHRYFNSRLKLQLMPELGEDAIVSRDRVSSFKNWIDR